MEYRETDLQVDQFYWLFHSDDSYSAVKLLQVDGDDCRVENFETGQQSHVSALSLVGMIPAPGETTLRTLYDDLTDAVDISEASILWNMRKRYHENIIYSSIGPILIAVNPYCYIDSLYNENVLQSYIDAYDNLLSPHIWTIAKASFDQLKRNSHRQAIVISGESGAGKTETTKKCLQYLSAVSMGTEKLMPQGGSQETPIEDKVVGSNPILESFGNAKTCRNNNSSRFGKWLEISFSCGFGKFSLIGANITQYLLEKSRVVVQAEDERNYHIFYQMCADESTDLGPAEQYLYLNQSGCTVIDGVNDMEEFQMTKSAFVALNFPERITTAILNALKAILHIGNISFEETSSGEGSHIISDSVYSLQHAAYLLGFSEEALSEALLNRTLNVRGEVMVVPLDPVQALDTRNAFSKEIYGRLFGQIVQQANKSLSFKTSHPGKKDKRDKIVSIGLLDIFGFEIFVSNSFEQLCINYGNEKLQQYFINYVLKKEQEVYEAEGIDVDRIETIDNEDILQFLEMKKSGLFALLDEELRLPRGSDSGFLKKVEKEHKAKTTRFRQDFRMKKDNFEIQHFAGVVLYDATNFLDKNKDKMYDHLEELLAQSSVDEFKCLMELGDDIGAKGDTKKTGSKKQTVTLASRFTGQLQALVNVLQESEPHFVRCLKPNSEKSPRLFESQLVLQQLRYSGVLEAIQIRKSGYPTRKLHGDFYSAYRVLSGIPVEQLKRLPSDKSRCEYILSKIAEKGDQISDIRVGNTMIFYRPETHNLLENWRLDIGLKAVLYLQASYRRIVALRRVKTYMDARTSLSHVMDLGRERNTCNIEALSFLNENIAYCQSIELPCAYVVLEALQIVQRLEAVQRCVEKLHYYVSDECSLSFSDITVEFDAINVVLKEAEAIELASDEYAFVALYKKRDELEDRVAVVLELRQVVCQLDEVSLGRCLLRYNSLREKHGDFCEIERQQASDLYDRMLLELSIIESASDILQDTQQELSRFVDDIDQNELESSNLTAALKSSMTPIVDCIDPLLAADYEFSSEAPKSIIKALETILEIRIQWATSNWKEVANTVTILEELRKNVWPPDCSCLSKSMFGFASIILDLISKELMLVSGGIDTNVILPLLKDGVEQGIAAIMPGSESDMGVNVEPLENAIEKVSRIHTIGTQAKAFLSFVESLLEFRKAIHIDNYELVLALTEPVDVTTYRFLRSSELLKFLCQCNSCENVKSANDAGGEPYFLFPRRDMSSVGEEQRLHTGKIKERAHGLPESMVSALHSVENELLEGRKFALNRYSQNILLSSLEQLRSTTTSNAVKILLLDEELTQSLVLAVKETETLWNSDHIVCGDFKNSSNVAQDMQNDLTSMLQSICKKLVEARKYLQTEDFDRIIDLYDSGYFKFSLFLKGRASTVPLVSKILDCVSEEFLIIVAEARNIKCERILKSSFEVGSVTGSLGQIDKGSISVDIVLEGIRVAKVCLADDVREASPLKILVDIADALVDARKAFQMFSAMEQRNALNKLLQYQDHIPTTLALEVDIMTNEADYNDCYSLLRDGLTWKNSFSYLLCQSNEKENDSEILNPNEMVLSRGRLSEALDVAEKLRIKLGDATLSGRFIDMNKAASTIQSLRESVTNLEWEKGESILKSIKQLNILENVPMIKDEVAEATSVISNAVHILKFEKALSEDKPNFSSIDLTIVDLSNTSVVQLEKSIERYQLHASKSKKTKALYNAAIIIRDLRRALIGGDWGSLNTLLKQAQESKVGNDKYTIMCADEIDVVSKAIQNQILIRSLKTALIEEVIDGKPGFINVEKISTAKLTSAVNATASIKDEVRGSFLDCLTALSEHVVNGREAAMKSEWNVIRGISDMWFERVENFRNAGRKINDNLMSVRPRSSSFDVEGKMGTSATFTGTNQFAIKEFEYLATVLTNEINCLQNHVTMLLLEADVSQAIQEGGVSSPDMVGNIDLSVIRTDGLETVLDRKTKLETDTNSSLPENVEKVCKAAQLILQIRKEILRDNWTTVPALLEEAVTGSYHPLPEACRQEVQVIRLECENRWIISMLTNALKSGGLEGTLDDHCTLEEVQSSSLNESVSFCTTLKPQTESALSLFLTCQYVLNLRQLLQKKPIQWKQIKHEAELGLKDEHKLHAAGLEEIKLIHTLAENTVVCDMMEHSLKKGGPHGEPGHLDVSCVTTEDLIEACQIAEGTTVKSKKANELFNACQLVTSLREAITHPSDDPLETLSTVKSIVKTIHDTHAKNPTDHGWRCCKSEIVLITKDAHIQELNSLLQNSVAVATQVYAHRNAASIGSKTSSRRKTVTKAPPAELEIESLDQILRYAEEMDFTSHVLDDLVGCARALRLLRMAMIKSDWEYGSQLAKRDDIINPITCVPYAMSELNYAKQEAHNKITASRLEAVLEQDFLPPDEEETDDDMNHTYLASRIQEAEESDITANSAKQLLECAKNVLLLRVGFSAKDSKQVAAALRWFSMNAYRCPPCVQEEAQKAYIMHQNSLLVTGLTSALQIGYATGVVGDLNTSSIDTQTLSKLLVQANTVKHKTPEVKELVEMAEIIYALRSAQRANDPKGVEKAMSFMSGRNKVLPAIVVQEIAFARIEKDNELTMSALKRALTTFDDSASKTLEISLHDTGSNSASIGMEEHKVPTSPSNKKSRRYSLANMNRPDIDLDSIDITSLDEGMESARKHGLFTAETKQLFRTVSIIKLLRVAMKMNDWPRVEEILQEIESAEKNEGKLHELASNEIMTIEKQLEMRSSIVDLSKALKSGWARCSNGIVDTQHMQINTLIDAIKRAEKSMQDLGMSRDIRQSSLEYACSTRRGDILSAITFKDVRSDLNQLSPSLHVLKESLSSLGDSTSSSQCDGSLSKSKVREQVQKLLLSALVVIDVRKALYEGRIQHAGSIAEDAIRCNCMHANVVDELAHYATEIGRALNMMRLCDQLNHGIKNGDSHSLRIAIKESKESSVSLSDDLGLLRTLENAEVALQAIVKVEKRLQSVNEVYCTRVLQHILEKAKGLNVAGPLVDGAQRRLDILNQFDTGVNDLNIHSGGLVTGKDAQRMICDLASSLHVSNHPLAHRANVLLKLSDAGFTRSIIASGCGAGNAYGVVTETIKYKMSLLKLNEFQDKYALEKFERLRDSNLFTMRLGLHYKEQKSSMLRYSDSAIGTSLTRLSPLLSTLAVFVFTHIVKVIDENASSVPEVLLRNMINVGRSCPIMRDEILLQLVKQLRSNPIEDSECRIWYMLRACLMHFPPSDIFENYLESFLYSCINARLDIRSHLAQHCIRNMHQAILLYGYNNKIFSKWDSHLGAVKSWLSPLPPALRHSPNFSKEAPTLNSSKSLGLNTKCDLFHGTVDPAFLPLSNKSLFKSSSLRGTRENWASRFESLGGFGHKDVKLEDFASAIFSPSTTMDRLDREVLMFWLSGITPPVSTIAHLRGELVSSYELFLHVDGEEEYRALERRNLLRSLPITTPRRLFTADAKGESVAVFFDIVEHCSIHDKELLNVSSPESKNRSRKRFSFVASSDIIVSQDDDDDIQDGVYLTCGMYRDFILVGIEKIIECATA